MSLTDEVTKRHIHTCEAIHDSLQKLSFSMRDSLKPNPLTASHKVVHAYERLEESLMWLESYMKELKGE